MSRFDLALFVVSLIAGGIASVSGFGIGSLLTPLLALKIDTKLAVAAVFRDYWADLSEIKEASGPPHCWDSKSRQKLSWQSRPQRE